MNNIAALYIRVSTDFQAEEGYSIDAQKQMLAAYCTSRSIPDYEYYIDGGYSGSNIERPELNRLIRDIKDKKIKCVVVYKLDRLSRSQKDTLYLIEDVFLPYEVDFISISESFDTSTPFGKAMIGILSVFAQLERENIRMRTRMGMRERVKSGLWMGGGRIPFGYDYDKESGILVKNEDAEKVKKIYSLYLQGYSTYRIAQVLGFSSEQLVKQILHRKNNCGYIIYNDEEFKGKHEPIISEEIYNKAMEMAKTRSRTQLYVTSPYLLAGMVECGVCGAKMRYQKWGKDKIKLYCYSRQKSKPYLVKDPNCDNMVLNAADVEKAVLNILFHTDYEDDNGIVTHTKTNIMDEIYRQKDLLENKLKRLYHLYAESENDLLFETIDEVQADMQKLIHHIELEEKKALTEKEKNTAIQTLSTFKDIWELATLQEKKRILHSLIEKVIVQHDKMQIVFRW